MKDECEWDRDTDAHIQRDCQQETIVERFTLADKRQARN